MPGQLIKYFFTFISSVTNHSYVSCINPYVFDIHPCVFGKEKIKSKLAKKHLKKHLFVFAWMINVGIQLIISIPTLAEVVRLDQVDLAGKHYAYLYQWSDPETRPKAIVIAIHGVTMHGLTYDRLAYHLAKEGAIVLSPDLPGCGRRWQKDRVSFLTSQEHLKDIIRSAKSTYKNIPIICLGESLGANLALSIAQAEPDLVDGIVLSSPALKRRINITPKIVVGSVNMVVGLLITDTEVDLSPYVRNYASEDPLIIQTMMNDPLIHRQIKCQELWDSCNAMKSVFKQAKLINKTTPILIIQGSQDRILKADAVIKLVSSLSSDDQTVKWFNNRGHMLLEECQPKPEVLQTLDDWFRTHVDKSLKQARSLSPASLPTLTEAVLKANNASNCNNLQ